MKCLRNSKISCQTSQVACRILYCDDIVVSLSDLPGDKNMTSKFEYFTVEIIEFVVNAITESIYGILVYFCSRAVDFLFHLRLTLVGLASKVVETAYLKIPFTPFSYRPSILHESIKKSA